MALELGDEGMSTATCLQDENLRELIDDELSRLQMVTSALIEGAAMPAWGDPGTCNTCEFEGICRKELWAEQI